MVVPHRHPRIVVRNDVNLLQGGRGSSAWAIMNLPRIRVEYDRNQKGNFVRNNVKGSKKTSQRLLNYNCRNRASFHLPFGPLNDDLNGKFKSFNRLKAPKQVRLRRSTSGFRCKDLIAFPRRARL